MANVKNKAPAFQFYPKDFLSDAKVIMMSREARGAYITLLCIDWLEDGIRAEYLAQLAGVAADSLAMAQLSECFVAHPNREGYITNPRLQKERKKQEENRKERSASGKKGAKAKWNRDLAPMAQPSVCHSSAMQEPMAKDGSSSSTASSSSDLNTNTPLAVAQAPVPKKSKPQVIATTGKTLHGKYVWLSDIEKEQMVVVHGEPFIQACINKLDAWIEMDPIPRKIKNGRNAAACFRSWVYDSVAKQQAERGVRQGTLGFKPHTAATTVEKNEQYLKERYGQGYVDEMYASLGFSETKLDIESDCGIGLALLPEGTPKRIGN